MWWRACIFVLALLLPISAIAFTIEGTISINGDPSVFYIDGYIDKNTFAYFKTRIRGVKTVVLDSPGGYVLPASKMARLIRKNKINTVVRSGGACFSACVLVFQSGINRIASRNAVFMLHPAVLIIEGIIIVDNLTTTRVKAQLIQYGMKRPALRHFYGNRDAFFNAAAALSYGIATEIVEK